MMYSIRSSVILLFLTMLIFSACRTSHSATMVSSETLSAETSQSSVSVDSSFTSLCRSLSLHADSIVLWLQDSETVQTASFTEDGRQFLSLNPKFCSSDSGFTALSPDCFLPMVRPSAKGHTIGKVLIGGVHLESFDTEMKSTSSLARDSLSTSVSHDSSLSERMDPKSPKGWSILFKVFSILAIIGSIIASAVVALRRTSLKK